MEYTENAAGRQIPTEIDGQPIRPFGGAFATTPAGRVQPRKIRHNRPGDEKLLDSIEKALRAVDFRNGMTVSFHHHFRNGDMVGNMVLDTIASMGFRDVIIAPSSMFPVHGKMLEYMKSGVIAHIEGGSVRDDVGRAVSEGLFDKPMRLRSHGGRTRAIECGELHIDVAFLGASAADPYGNCTGQFGPNACGPLGFAFADAWYADNVVIVSDNIVDYPCTPFSIPEYYVDHVVQVDRAGDPAGILSGETKVTTDPGKLAIAENVARVLAAAGVLKDGFSFQAGAGGISLAACQYVREALADKNAVASFAMGGITGHSVDMLREGTLKTVLNAQAFDMKSVESLYEDRDHLEVSHYHFGNPHTGGTITHRMDTAFLGATEVDVHFNANVNTFSNGYLLKPAGGHPDAAAGARITIITAPIVRKKFPVIRDNVTTITTPGETVDVIVTDRGIAVNPLNTWLTKKLAGSGLPLVDINALKDEAYAITGGAPEVNTSDRIVGLIEYRDGTIIDTVKQVIKE